MPSPLHSLLAAFHSLRHRLPTACKRLANRLQQQTEVLDKRGAVGLLIVLPSEAELNAGSIAAAELGRWRALEQFLLSREFQAPIYFAFESQDLAAIVDKSVPNPPLATRSPPSPSLLLPCSCAAPAFSSTAPTLALAPFTTALVADDLCGLAWRGVA